MKKGEKTSEDSSCSSRALTFHRWVPGFIPWMLRRKVLERGRGFLTQSGGSEEGSSDDRGASVGGRESSSVMGLGDGVDCS